MKGIEVQYPQQINNEDLVDYQVVLLCQVLELTPFNVEEICSLTVFMRYTNLIFT